MVCDSDAWRRQRIRAARPEPVMGSRRRMEVNPKPLNAAIVVTTPDLERSRRRSAVGRLYGQTGGIPKLVLTERHPRAERTGLTRLGPSPSVHVEPDCPVGRPSGRLKARDEDRREAKHNRLRQQCLSAGAYLLNIQVIAFPWAGPNVGGAELAEQILPADGPLVATPCEQYRLTAHRAAGERDGRARTGLSRGLGFPCLKKTTANGLPHPTIVVRSLV